MFFAYFSSVFFFSYWFMWSRYKFFIDYMSCKYCLQFCRVPFLCSVNGVFFWTEDLNFNVVQLIDFLFFKDFSSWFYLNRLFFLSLINRVLLSLLSHRQCMNLSIPFLLSPIVSHTCQYWSFGISFASVAGYCIYYWVLYVSLTLGSDCKFLASFQEHGSQ